MVDKVLSLVLWLEEALVGLPGGGLWSESGSRGGGGQEAAEESYDARSNNGRFVHIVVNGGRWVYMVESEGFVICFVWRDGMGFLTQSPCPNSFIDITQPSNR